MSPLHHDHLLVEGSEPVKGTGSTLGTARGTSRKPVAEQATITVPTQRQGKPQLIGSIQATDVPPTRRTVAATAAGTIAARAKATGKVASAKAATARAATARAVTTAKAAAAAKAAARAARNATVPATTPAPQLAAAAVQAPVATPAAEPVVAVPPSVAEPAAATVSTEAAAVRPTPFKRAAEPVGTTVAESTADELVPAAEETPRSRFSLRPPLRRRPALYLTAALAAALSVSAFSAGDPAAQATSNVSHSVSIAEELGIEAAAADEITALDATERLGELAVSRNVRDAEQAAAAQHQARADQAAAAAAAEAARPKAVLPVSGARLTSGFGSRWGTTHAGIDLAAPMRTPEYAAMDGVVLKAGAASGYGLAVYIQHANGDVTVYGHMDSILVSQGQVVRAGETIALLGNRGQSTGPHLHFEVHVGGMNGQKIDPLPWLRARGVAI